MNGIVRAPKSLFHNPFLHINWAWRMWSGKRYSPCSCRRFLLLVMMLWLAGRITWQGPIF
jgi:hypothetical protein